MYAYSLPLEDAAQVPATQALAVLSEALGSTWFRIVGGVYTYVDAILQHLDRDKVFVNSHIEGVERHDAGVTIRFESGESFHCDKVVFATLPSQVLSLLVDASDAEKRRFGPWRDHLSKTIVHTDAAIYERYPVDSHSAFDLFQKADGDFGYNAFLNELIGVSRDNPTSYCLGFNLEEWIDPKKTVHCQEHRTPRYSVDATRYREEIQRTNGENNTLHAGAYLYKGLHEDAIKSAAKVADILG